MYRDSHISTAGKHTYLPNTLQLWQRVCPSCC